MNYQVTCDITKIMTNFSCFGSDVINIIREDFVLSDLMD